MLYMSHIMEKKVENHLYGGIPLERGYPGMLTSLPQGLINNTRSKV